MSPAYDLLAIDVDGTLVDETSTVSDRVRRVLTAVVEEGTRVCLCTGRALFATQTYIDQLRLVTPPVGACLNACTKICGMPIVRIFRHAVPFILCNVVILVLVTFVPALSLWLPGLIMR